MFLNDLAISWRLVGDSGNYLVMVISRPLLVIARSVKNSLRRRIKAKEIEKTKPNSAGEIHPSDVVVLSFESQKAKKANYIRLKTWDCYVSETTNTQ